MPTGGPIFRKMPRKDDRKVRDRNNLSTGGYSDARKEDEAGKFIGLLLGVPVGLFLLVGVVGYLATRAVYPQPVVGGECAGGLYEASFDNTVFDPDSERFRVEVTFQKFRELDTVVGQFDVPASGELADVQLQSDLDSATCTVVVLEW